MAAAAAVLAFVVAVVVIANSGSGTVVTDVPTPTVVRQEPSVVPAVTLRPAELEAAATVYEAWLAGLGVGDRTVNLTWRFEFDEITCRQVRDVVELAAACVADGQTDALTRAVNAAWTYSSEATVLFGPDVMPEGDPVGYAIVDPNVDVRERYLDWLDVNAPAAWSLHRCADGAESVVECVRLLVDSDRVATWLATAPPLPWTVVTVDPDITPVAAAHARAFLEGTEPFVPNPWAIDVRAMACDRLDGDGSSGRFRCTSDQTDAMTRQVSSAWVYSTTHTVTVVDGNAEGAPSAGVVDDPFQSLIDDYLSWLSQALTAGPWVDAQCSLNFATVPSCTEIFVDPENVSAWIDQTPGVLESFPE